MAYLLLEEMGGPTLSLGADDMLLTTKDTALGGTTLLKEVLLWF